MKDEIKKEMLKAFDVLLGKYGSVGIWYENNAFYGCYLVSIDVSTLKKSELDDFSDLLLSQIKELQEKFGEEAPLFSINEEWFSLTQDAISYTPHSMDESLRIGKTAPRVIRSHSAERIYHH